MDNWVTREHGLLSLDGFLSLESVVGEERRVLSVEGAALQGSDGAGMGEEEGGEGGEHGDERAGG